MTTRSVNIPVLTTERLTLRAMAASDWPAFWQFMASDRAVHMGGPFDRDTAWGMFASDAAHWSFFGHGGLMIEAEEGTVGQVAILNPPAFPQEELGWLLFDGVEAKGYATEAARALRDWYYSDHPAPKRLVSFVSPDNTASARVAQRLGAELAPDLTGLDADDHVYLHPAPEALQ